MLITEANLSNFDELISTINKVLDDRNVPAYSGSEANKVRSWFTKKYVQAIKDDEVDIPTQPHKYKDGEPEWMNKPDVMDFTGELTAEIVDEIVHIIDYFATLEPNDLRKIDREPYKVIKQKVADWDREMKSTSNDQRNEDNLKKQLVPNVDYKVVETLPSGLKWVKLISPKSKDVEGDSMGHCVANDAYETEDIYSLWDNKNRSHVTIEANDRRKTIKQIKGKGNKSPVEKYIPACVDYIVKSILDGYSILGDGQFFGMVKYNEEFYFDRVEDIPEKYRDNVKLRKWFDQIYPTIVYPRQQQAIADLMKRIKLV